MVTLSVAVYAGVLDCGLFPWDDAEYVAAAQEAASDILRSGTFVQGNYHPLTIASLRVDLLLGQGDARSFHATNIILHALNVLMVCHLMHLSVERSGLRLLLLSSFFVVHPVQVETVAWVAERKNLLFAFFFLASCIIYKHYLNSGDRRSYGLILLLYGLAMLSKVQALVLPLVLFGMSIIFEHRARWRHRVVELLPMLLLMAAGIYVGVEVQETGNYVHVGREDTLLLRLVVILNAMVLPYTTLFLPQLVSIIKPLPNAMSSELWLFAIVGLVGFVGWVIQVLRKDPLTSGLGLIAIALVLPVSQIIPFGSAISADRYSYLPLALVLIALAALIRKLPFGISAIALAALMVGSTFASYTRIQAWCSPKELFRAALQHYPESEMAHMNLGAGHARANELDSALYHLNSALAIAPDLIEAKLLRGDILNKVGEHLKAFNDYDSILSSSPSWTGLWRAHLGRARANIALGRSNEALADLYQVDDRKVLSGELEYLKGLAMALQQDHIQALGLYRSALKRGYTTNILYLNMAISEGALGDFESSREHSEMVTRADSSNADAWFLLGLSHFRTGSDGCAALAKARQLQHPKAQEIWKLFCAELP